MKIRDLKEVTVGLKIRSLMNRERIGTVVSINKNDDDYATVKWNDDTPDSGFYGTDCDCEIATEV